MQTLQLTNEKFKIGSKSRKAITVTYTLVAIWLSTFSHSTQGTLGILFVAAVIYILTLHFYRRSITKFTITDTHFQQHTYKGGWVLQWRNIGNLGRCISKDPTAEPLPWIGIKLSEPERFINSISPRVISEILLQQRALLYLGASEQGAQEKFQDMVLDSREVVKEAFVLKGLQASLYRRMQHQRQFWGFDLFIAIGDLDRDGDEFVGLMRQYWAAARTS